jgi:tRNA G46 methylase TrmB
LSYRGAKTTLILDLARRGVNQTVKEALMRRRAFRPALAFHGLTPLYDRGNDLLGFGAPFLGRVIDVRGDEQLVEIGCGTGSLLSALGQRHARMRLTGIDADPRVLHGARDKLSAAGVRAARRIRRDRDQSPRAAPGDAP